MGESYDYDYEYNDTDPGMSVSDVHPPHCTDVKCIILTILNVIIVVLGLVGNGLVIWIAGFKTNSRLKTINTVWYLSLAVSDFLFCAFLPFSIVNTVRKGWIFGKFMCKFTSFILFLNMFSSIFLLVIISVDRCIVVMFPVWAQNKRNIRKALVVVLLAWVSSSLLSFPAAIFREITLPNKKNLNRISCFYNYAHDEQHIAFVINRFIIGFVIPLLIIITCYFFIIRKLKNNHMTKSNKPFMIMRALIGTFFICWLPYHFFNLLELELKDPIIHRGQEVATILVSANSFMNPLLYAFMGKDFKKKCYALLSKIESTFDEDARSTLRGTTVTNSGDGRLSSVV